MLRRFHVFVMALLLALPVYAAIEEVEFNDGQQLVRYKALIAELRCPMCLNANLAGSDAPIAADLRAETGRNCVLKRTLDSGIKSAKKAFNSVCPHLNKGAKGNKPKPQQPKP